MIKYIEHYPTINSTMDLAEKYIKEQKYDDHFLIVADQQTNGRGRKGNTWVSDINGLWFSLVINHISGHKSFTIFVGLCILNSLIELTENYDFKLKWPNDIYLYDKKVCGLICSQFSKYHKTSLCIGINTNNNKPTLDTADTIKNILNIKIENDIYLQKILGSILNNIHKFEESGISIFADILLKHDYLQGKKIKVLSGYDTYEGNYKGLNNEGELLIEINPDMIQNISSGTIINL